MRRLVFTDCFMCFTEKITQEAYFHYFDVYIRFTFESNAFGRSHVTMNNQTTNNTDKRPPQNNRSSNIVGFIILFLGIAILLKNLDMGILIPSWLFGWEMILIAIGIVIGVNSRFEKKSAIIFIAIGFIFLLKNIVDIPISRFVIPAAAIVLGIYLLNRNKSSSTPPPHPPNTGDDFDWDKRVKPEASPTGTAESTAPHDSSSFAPPENAEQKTYGRGFSTDFENYVKVDNFFSDTKKVVLSKNFLGGNITSVFGSTSLNFLQADLNQVVVIDTFQLFGSTKIIVPTHWKVYTNVSSVFGEVDDRRPIIGVVADDDKKIYITGTSIFGGLTIKNS